MAVLKKIMTSFMLPPGIFIFLIVGYGVGCILVKRRWRGWVWVLFGLIAWALSISPVTDALIKPLESAFVIPENPDGDVIILLGSGISRGMPDMSGRGTLSMQSMQRAVTAIRLQRRLGVPIIVSGRGDDRYGPATAVIVTRFFSELGVPIGKIIVEDRSRDTFENIAFSAKICQDRGFHRPILVTSAYHLKRAMLCFKNSALAVLPFPSGFETWEGKVYFWRSFLPGDYRKASIALKEYLGLLYYQVTLAPLSSHIVS